MVEVVVDGVVAVEPVTTMAFVPLAAFVLVVMFLGLRFGVIDPPRRQGARHRRIGSPGLESRS